MWCRVAAFPPTRKLRVEVSKGMSCDEFLIVCFHKKNNRRNDCVAAVVIFRTTKWSTELIKLTEGCLLGRGDVGEFAVDVGVKCLGVDLDLRHVAVEYHVGFSELAHTVDGIDGALEAKLLFRISEQ